MARVSADEQATRKEQATAAAQSTAAYDTAQSDIGQFNQNQATLARGGQVAANPWLSARYLSNQNRQQSQALNQETNAGQDELQRANLRSGGLNGALAVNASKDLALKKMRLADTLSAERSGEDFNKNVAYQQSMAGAPLQAANAESPFYSSANNLEGDTLSDLQKYDEARAKNRYGLLNTALKVGAAAALTAATGGAGAVAAPAIMSS